MKELEYPFDASYILMKKKKIKKNLLQSNQNYLEKKIAILGGSTTSNIKLVLELFLLNYGIKAEFYESQYNKFYEEAIFQNEELEKFSPDIIYIHTSNRNISRFPIIQDEAEDIDKLLQLELEKYKSIWNNLKSKYNCSIIQNNFEMPFYRLMGNKDASDIHGKVNFITRLNLEFYSYAQSSKDFFICDINYISADYGLKEWADPFYYYMYKYSLNVNAIPLLSFNVANIIKSILGKNKKGFVLDLDNTLWGGVIGDDGVDNILLGPEDSLGQAYLEFQKYLKEHKDIGIVLNITSKNDRKNALMGLEHPSSEFSKKDFIEILANWNSKDENFLKIANTLNLGPDSLVFIDDNPAERYIIQEQIKGVIAPEIGLVHSYIHNIDRNGFFEMTVISDDDITRNEMYQENLNRIEYQKTFLNYDEYLISLSMKGEIRHFDSIYFARIAQLTNKSNQFNLTTKRYSQSEIEQIANSDKYVTLYGKLTDKFGDNGVVSIIIGKIENNECHIDLWIMSCRVLKRNMEFAMMDSLVAWCKNSSIKSIHGYYYPTNKNSMVLKHYEILGFNKIHEDNKGNIKWYFDIPNDYKKKNCVIELEC